MLKNRATVRRCVEVSVKNHKSVIVYTIDTHDFTADFYLLLPKKMY